MHAALRRPGVVLLLALATLPVAAMQQQQQQQPPVPAAREPRIEELWVEPEPNRNLLYGVGGRQLAPDPKERYQVREIKLRGFSEGFTLVDSKDREWSAKLPPESFAEVAASRILWAAGFHQPPIYMLREWQADGARAPNPQLPARFRQKDPDFHGLQSGDSWSFKDNPFVGTRQLNGLLVLQVMIANPDIKPSNNTIYTLKSAAEGAQRWYVVRDLGYSLGSAGFNSPRADIEAFEKAPFIRGVADGKVQFYYGGLNKKLVENITVQDVHWICQRLAKISDEQWRDAFRAAAYESSIAERYIARFKTKIAEGLALK